MEHLFSVCVFFLRSLAPLLFPRLSRLSNLKIPIWLGKGPVQDFVLYIIVESFQLHHQAVDSFLFCFSFGRRHFRCRGYRCILCYCHSGLQVRWWAIRLFGAVAGQMSLYFTVEALP